MAYQLIYTSAPKSLTIGRTGFSVVARSKAMSDKLASAVERCSTYDINCGEIFSHRILSFSGEVWHILTRICDSGVDYTNRNNYIAHHLILSNDEIKNLANPAEILLQWNGWKSSWEGEPRYIEEINDLHKIKTSNSLPAVNWQNYFGNPSKAAILLNENIVISAPPKNARILLNLFSESLLLNITPEDAWNTTFTTSFSSSENPNDFNWRTVANCDTALINLPARIAPNAPNNRASQYAATGVMNNRERLNLQVKAPTPQTHFRIVETPKDNPSPKIAYIASAIVSLLSLLIVLYLVVETFLPTEPQKTETPQPLPKLTPTNVVTAESKIQPKSQPVMSLLDTVNLVRENIEADNYEQALILWDTSRHAEKNPSLRDDLLADIGARIDVLLRFAENTLSLSEKNDAIYNTAIENLAKAKRALDIQGIPKKDKRFAKWENLNNKVKK